MDVYEALEKALEQNEIELFKNIYFSAENEKFKHEFSWDLALLLITYLDKFSKQTQVESICFLKNINKQLCQCYANPKEIFIVYLENAQIFLNEQNFDHLIDLMEIIFLKSSTKFVTSSIQSVFRLFNKYLSNTKYKNQIELIFMHFNNLTNKFSESSELKCMITAFLIELFSRIFKNEIFNPEIQFTIDKTVDQIKKINKNLFILTRNFEYLSNESEFSVDKTALSLFLGYILVKQSQLDYDYLDLPKVYQNIFIFDECLITINRLFNNLSNELFIKCGLFAIKYLTARLDEKILTEDYLEFGPLINLFESLFRISVNAQSEICRKLSNQTLKIEFKLFSREARFYFIRYFFCFYSKASESLSIYVLSYLAYLLKEEINESLNLEENFYLSKKSNLKNIFSLILEKKKFDVIKESSLVISLLSLIRLILLKDKADKTGIYSVVKNLIIKYLFNVEENCDESQKFYLADLKNLLDKPVKKDNVEKTIRINQEVSDEPTKQQQIESLESSLQTVNLIKSLKNRIEELYEDLKNK